MRWLALFVLLLFSVTAAGGSSAQQETSIDRLPWGDPDLQGTWTNTTLTGLERFEGMDELVISEAEARALEQRDAQFSADIDALPDGELPKGDIVGGYNSA